MLSRRTLRWRLAPPFPSPLPVLRRSWGERRGGGRENVLVPQSSVFRGCIPFPPSFSLLPLCPLPRYLVDPNTQLSALSHLPCRVPTCLLRRLPEINHEGEKAASSPCVMSYGACEWSRMRLCTCVFRENRRAFVGTASRRRENERFFCFRHFTPQLSFPCPPLLPLPRATSRIHNTSSSHTRSIAKAKRCL